MFLIKYFNRSTQSMTILVGVPVTGAGAAREQRFREKIGLTDFSETDICGAHRRGEQWRFPPGSS